MDAETIAKGLSEGARSALWAAQPMASKRHRVPWRTEPENLRGLMDRRLIDEGGYLTELGFEVRHTLWNQDALKA